MTKPIIEKTSDPNTVKPVNKVEKIKNLPWYIAFTTTNSMAIHLTFVGSIFILYLNELGLNKVLLGTILSILPLINIFSVLIAPKIAEIGVRKVFLFSFIARYLIWLPIVLSPLVKNLFGPNIMVMMLVSIVVVFSIFRMVNMVAILPWNQEIIPESIRGVFSAKQMIFANIANVVTVTLAGLYIEKMDGIKPFNVLFLFGIVFGLMSAWIASHFPGGEARPSAATDLNIIQSIFTPLKDKNFRNYISGIGLILLAESLFSFVAIYMSEEIGLSAGNIVILQTGALVGGALTSYLWGWAADRFGSKPILHVNMVFIAILPVCWFIMPYRSPLSLYIAMGIAVLQGAAQMGRVIGGSRLLYNRMVPVQKSASYMAFYNAWLGLVMGISQLFGGVLLGAFENIRGSVWRFPINSYSIMFVLMLLFSILGIIFTTFIKTEGEVSMGEFVGMFLKGNPLLAFETLISYQRPRAERETISLTERIGRTQSDLIIDELQASLDDPRFYVRYEAIVSIARHHPHPQLTKSLIEILNGKDPALSVISAWALGRIEDPGAIDALRLALNSSEYRSVRAHSARSLGALGDRLSIPTLLSLFHQETDRGLLQAYATALGHLGVKTIFDEVLNLMLSSSWEKDRIELTLTLGRLLGNEDDFILINRQLREDFNTNASQIVRGLSIEAEELENAKLISYCASKFADGQIELAAQVLLEICQILFCSREDSMRKSLVLTFEEHLKETKEIRVDLLVLCIFALFVYSENK
jgi:MFS family permease